MPCFLKNLADKTGRGLRERVEKRKSSGGLTYGYKVMKKQNSEGEAIRGDCEIIGEQASISWHIFEDYAYKNKSPKAIVAELNKEGIITASGKPWRQSSFSKFSHQNLMGSTGAFKDNGRDKAYSTFDTYKNPANKVFFIW